jgi:NADH-quinone oxidoreductase subunit J
VPLVGVFLILVALALRSITLSGPARGPAVAGGVEAIGRVLFTDYLFPFELTSVLLLAAIVGVMALTKRKA